MPITIRRPRLVLAERGFYLTEFVAVVPLPVNVMARLAQRLREWV